MSDIPQRAETQGSTTFDPEKFFDAWAKEEITPPYDNDFRKFVIKSFGLKLDDSFVYRAIAEVNLLQAQTYLEFGGQNGLHRWYNDSEGNEVSRKTHGTRARSPVLYMEGRPETNINRDQHRPQSILLLTMTSFDPQRILRMH